MFTYPTAEGVGNIKHSAFVDELKSTLLGLVSIFMTKLLSIITGVVNFQVRTPFFIPGLIIGGITVVIVYFNIGTVLIYLDINSPVA